MSVTPAEMNSVVSRMAGSKPADLYRSIYQDQLLVQKLESQQTPLSVNNPYILGPQTSVVSGSSGDGEEVVRSFCDPLNYITTEWRRLAFYNYCVILGYINGYYLSGTGFWINPVVTKVDATIYGAVSSIVSVQIHDARAYFLDNYNIQGQVLGSVTIGITVKDIPLGYTTEPLPLGFRYNTYYGSFDLW